jgi:uncharacterized protein (TIGR02271 family)
LRAHRKSPTAAHRGQSQGNASDGAKVPVVEEQVRVHAQPVETERVRITKAVTAREATVAPLLVADDVQVERRTLDPPRFVDQAPPIRYEGDTTIIPVLEERLVVEKRLVVREELRITRTRREYREPQRVVLRSEHVSVERSQPTTQPDGCTAGRRPLRATSLSLPTQKEKDMDRMLVGVFDSKQAMETACRDLQDSGIPNDRVQVHSGSPEETLGSTNFAKPDGEQGTGFFDRLFGRVDEGKDRHAKLYSEAVRRGGCVVVVDGISDDRVDEAARILERDGAYDIDERAAKWRESGWNEDVRNDTLASQGELQAERTRDTTMQQQGIDQNRMSHEAATKIPVVEEQLNVGKREVQRGGVRIFTRTTERPVEENVTLREEHARVERHPVDRPATEAELGNAFEEKSVELRETAEEPVVAKTARVVEEVDVDKEVSTRTETVRDTVRRRDVEVEDLPASRVNKPADGDRAGRR